MEAAQTGAYYTAAEIVAARLRMAEAGWEVVRDAALGMEKEEYVLRHMAQWKPLILVAAEAGGVGIWQGY